MSDPSRIVVLGAGNWGTTVAQLVAAAGHEVLLWTRSEEQRQEIQSAHTNRRYTGEVEISARVEATTDLERAIAQGAVVFIVVPSNAFREVSRRLGELARPDQVYLHGTKGLELGTHRRMSEILLEETCIRQLGVLSGPNIATEILRGQPAGTVLASRYPRVQEAGRRALQSKDFRVFTGDDVAGVELAGALKNVVAIAAGVADEMRLGENTKAMLITRGISEMAKLGIALGAEPSTFFGMSGIGDLVVTCESPHSRNHKLGVALAKGAKLEEALAAIGMVAEGVNTAKAVQELSQRWPVDLPLFHKVHEVLFQGLSPAVALEQLMTLPPARDVPQVLA